MLLQCKVLTLFISPVINVSWFLLSGNLFVICINIEFGEMPALDHLASFECPWHSLHFPGESSWDIDAVASVLIPRKVCDVTYRYRDESWQLFFLFSCYVEHYLLLYRGDQTLLLMSVSSYKQVLLPPVVLDSGTRLWDSQAISGTLTFCKIQLRLCLLWEAAPGMFAPTLLPDVVGRIDAQVAPMSLSATVLVLV